MFKERIQNSVVSSKNKHILILTFLFLITSGCQDTGELTPEQMVDVGSQIESLTEQVEIYKELIVSYANLLQQSGAIDANDLAAVNKLIEEADRVTPEMNKIAAAIKEGNYSDSQGLITLLEGLRAANTATAGFNKYWAAIDAVLLLAITILGWLAKKKSGQANLATTTLGAVTKAIEGTTEEVMGMVKPRVAANLSAANITAAGKALISKTKAA